MLLKSTQKLQVLLSAGITTNQLPVVASWADVNATAAISLATDSIDTTTNSTTAVDVVAAPAAGITRQVKYLSVHNADTAVATVTVQVNNAGTARIIAKFTLLSGSRLEYTQGAGFSVFNSDGAVIGIGQTGPSGRIPNVQAVVSTATLTPTFSDDLVKVTAQAAALAIANPTGTAIPGLGMVIRLKDNGTFRTITWDTQYRAADGVTLPTVTIVGKTLYIAMIYNSDDTKWDVLTVAAIT